MSSPETGDSVLAAISGLGHLSRRLTQLHTRLWQELVDREVTGPQFTVLGLLHLRGVMDQGTLGELAYLDKSTIAPVLNRLLQRQLIEVTRDDNDRRRKLVAVTDPGRDVVRRLTPAVLAVNDRMLAPLPADDRERFLASLERILQGSTEAE
ncbi:MarR family winged helix-turn-helix transcriptional regulator [Saccharopolyspora rosea]|uniref:MarR family winged helix-turn-helix transcriptional regulator n=1 Tax=Saccharopolyspora rosea TaxID=524884 RepID=A0ABW3FWY4_9PSEU|nr:MarR family transcriptional regulator [Saccharopolyspora rosea]